MSIVVSIRHRKNEDSAIHGDMVTVAKLSDGTERIVDNWYSDERESHLKDYDVEPLTLLERIQKYVHDKDVQYIRSWV